MTEYQKNSEEQKDSDCKMARKKVIVEHKPKTFVELKEYTDVRIKALEDAVALARENLDIRLERMNEFRDQINSERSSYATKDNIDLRIRPLAESVGEIGPLKTEVDSLSNYIKNPTISIKTMIAYLFTSLGATGTLLAILRILHLM